MLGTYFIYYSVAFIGWGIAFADNHNRKNVSIWCIFIILLYSFVIGLKYSVGPDFTSYLLHYQRVYEGNESEMYFEKGFLIINRIFAFFRIPPAFFFVAFNMINIIAIISISKRILPKALPWAFIIFFMMDYGMSLSTNIYRQYLSISLTALSLPFALQQNKYKYLYVFLCFCIAQVHSSAYLCIAYLFLVDKTIVKAKNRIFWIILIGLLYIYGAYMMPLFSGLMKTFSNIIGYNDRDYLTNTFHQVELGGGLGVLLKFIQSAIAIWYFPLIKAKLHDSRLFILCFNGFFIGSLIKPFFFTNLTLLRSIGAFLYFEYIIVGITIWFLLKKKNVNEFFLGCFLFFSYIILFYSYISISINWMSPYILFPNFYG